MLNKMASLMSTNVVQNNQVVDKDGRYKFLSDEFLAKYPDFPDNMNALSQIVFIRTYSRYIPSLKRRETYKEVCLRVVNYSFNLLVDHMRKINYKFDFEKNVKEAELFFHNIFNLKQFCSGRTLFVGGSSAIKKSVMSNYNCSFINITSWKDIGEIFYNLLVGIGVGYKVSKETVKLLPKIRINTKLEHSEYKALPPEQRIENSEFVTLPNGYAKLYIGDSKEAWHKAVDYYILLLTDEKYEFVHTIKISYNSIRPAGERLKTFGGHASGYEPLKQLFQGFDNVLKNKIDSNLDPIIADEKGYGQVRPIHLLDTATLEGEGVVMG